MRDKLWASLAGVGPVLVLVDGEHHPRATRSAIAELPFPVAGALLVGGQEKLRGQLELGVPLFVGGLAAALAATAATAVLDLSDAPVLDGPRRLELASRALAQDVPYLGADFVFTPPPLAGYPLPSVSVVGAGKRVGKTALCAHYARLLGSQRNVVVAAMGRGGPDAPELVASPPELTTLLQLSRTGRHAASDHLEDALLTGQPTIGTRRCGGGLAGTVISSNVTAGADLALSLRPELVLFEGSGTALPPIDTGGRVLVVSARQRPAEVLDHLGLFRVLVSDLVVVTTGGHCPDPGPLRQAIGEVSDVPVVAVGFSAHPLAEIAGRRVAVFTTAPPAVGQVAAELGQRHGARVVHASGTLADRSRLATELDRLDRVEAEVYLVELKAAAVDLVAEHAVRRGAQVVFLDNRLVPLPGQGQLDPALLAVAEQAVRTGATPGRGHPVS